MNRQYPLAVLSFLGIALLLLVSGCEKNHERLYAVYDPIYISHDSALAAINGKTSQGMINPRKVYVTDAYIFISDSSRGIHIFDNRNPTHPVKVAFLAIPGNQDIAVKGNTLYADMFSELLAIDISDMHHVKITGELPHLFFNNGYGTTPTGDKIVVGYKITYRKIADTRGLPGGGGIYFNLAPAAYAASFSSSTTPGVAGSTAKMVLVGNNLYTVPDGHNIQVVNVENAAQPQAGVAVYGGIDLETIYPFKDKLFVGSKEGVFIYDLTDPANPTPMGTFTHGTACDPVIADDKYAYVTLHAGTSCGGTANEMDILNVEYLFSPARVKVVPMTSPRGLTKDGNLLFVCDPPGVKIFDASNPESPQLQNTLSVGNAYDVVAMNKHIVVMSDKGVYQFDYSRPGVPLLSVLSLTGH